MSDFSFAQRDVKEKLPREKIEALEKIKLIETLDMDEETTVKFFARRNDHQEKMKNLFDELDEKRSMIKEKISSAKNDNEPEIKKMVDNYFLLQEKLDDERKRFINSLADILSYKQIAELTLFERRFREEIREILFHHKKKKRN
jgi:hypothetical protein